MWAICLLKLARSDPRVSLQQIHRPMSPKASPGAPVSIAQRTESRATLVTLLVMVWIVLSWVFTSVRRRIFSRSASLCSVAMRIATRFQKGVSSDEPSCSRCRLSSLTFSSRVAATARSLSISCLGVTRLVAGVEPWTDAWGRVSGTALSLLLSSLELTSFAQTHAPLERLKLPVNS